MSKPRDRGLIITRGVPGTGKSTYVDAIRDATANNEKITIINRDDIRMCVCKEWIQSGKYYVHCDSSPMSVEEMYQVSFRNEILNRKVKEKYWRVVNEEMNREDNEIIIIDSCFLDIEDIVMLKTIKSLCKYKYYTTIYEFTKEYESIHNVPQRIMEEYRRKAQANRQHAYKLADKYVFVK